MARHSKVAEFLETLPAEKREAYEKLLRDARTTLDDAHAWLLDNGFAGGRTAVWTHQRNFDEVCKSVQRSAEMAASFVQVAKDGGDVAALSDATLTRFQQLLMERLMTIDETTDLTAGDWHNLAKAVNNAIQAKQRVQDIRERFEDAMERLTRKSAGGKKAITPEDIAEARKLIFGN